MSSSALTAPQVNLDEFERRLRAAGSPVGPQEDPLDELARLVGADAREARHPQRVFDFAPKVETPRLPPVHPLRVDEAAIEDDGVDHFAAEAEAQTVEDATLRGALDDGAADADFDLHDYTSQADGAHSVAIEHQIMTSGGEVEHAPRRSRRAAVTMGALVAVGAVALMAAWVVKGAPGLPKTPPLIMAADGPVKVQPPSQDTVVSPNDSASVLLNDQKGKSEPVKLASSEEQPVDLQQLANVQPAPAAPSPAPIVAPSAPTTSPVASAPAAAVAPGAAPAGATRSIALTSVGPTSAAPAAPAAFPEPRRVKTVSVRPDGSLISAGSEAVADAAPTADASAAQPAPATPPGSAAATDDAAPQPANPPVPRARPSFDASASGAAQPATPKLDLPTKLSPKSTTRVAVAKTDTTVANESAQSPEAPAQKTPLQIVPDILNSMAKAVTGQPQQTQVASADPVATATTGAGSYAVQLAAPGTDKEAQSASARLQSKYASALGGMQTSVHEADVNGRSIYRVRVTGLTRADAVSLCQKLKASGGDGACFVAKD